jgi:hypothetical protein
MRFLAPTGPQPQGFKTDLRHLDSPNLLVDEVGRSIYFIYKSAFGPALSQGGLHMRSRRLVVCAALAGSVAIAVALPGTAAFAKTPKPVKVVCTSLNGNASTENLTGCSDVGTTGGSGTDDVSTSTITWNSGLTSVSSVTNKEKTGKADKCTAPSGDSNVTEVDVKGTVTGGTATTLTGGKVKGTICVFETADSGIVTQNYPGTSFDV